MWNVILINSFLYYVILLISCFAFLSLQATLHQLNNKFITNFIPKDLFSTNLLPTKQHWMISNCINSGTTKVAHRHRILFSFSSLHVLLQPFSLRVLDWENSFCPSLSYLLRLVFKTKGSEGKFSCLKFFPSNLHNRFKFHWTIIYQDLNDCSDVTI